MGDKQRKTAENSGKGGQVDTCDQVTCPERSRPVGSRRHSSYAAPTISSLGGYTFPQGVLIDRLFGPLFRLLPLVPAVTPLQTSHPAPRTSEFPKTDIDVPPSFRRGPGKSSAVALKYLRKHKIHTLSYLVSRHGTQCLWSQKKNHAGCR